MKTLTLEEIEQISAGLFDSQLSYLITSAFQTIIIIGFKCCFANNLNRDFLVQNVGVPILNVTALGLGYEIANYYLNNKNSSSDLNNIT